MSRGKQTRKGQEEGRNSEKTANQNQKSSLPVVGIGASAGGLEAFTALLKMLPPDLGMAYILVPHLDPTRTSAYTEILSRTTSMPVVQIGNGMHIEPNRVFIIPPNCDLTISNSLLHISEREENGRPVNTTIDIFLRSLASDQGGQRHRRSAVGYGI